MANLYIIGNGFDKAHGMKTEYSDFRNYLITTYLPEYDYKWDSCEIPLPVTYPDGDERYDAEMVVKTIVRILDETEGGLWNNVETSLGKLNYDEFLDDYGLYDDNISHECYRNEDNAKYLCGALMQIGIYFQAWVGTIKIADKPIPNLKNLINPQSDLFLNFNYTNTLEKLYNTDNVCHIHGTQYEEIYFGHGNDTHDTDNIQRKWFGAESELNRLQDFLRKDTDTAYQNNKIFFATIKEEAKKGNFNIFAFGFSFSEVDRVYLENIFRVIPSQEVNFYLNEYHDEKERKIFADIIKECGFKGKISSYKV